MRTISGIACLICLVSVAGAASQLTFDNKGEPTGMVIGDADYLKQTNRDGFAIGNGDENVAIQSCITKGDLVEVTAAGGSPVFTVRIDKHDKYLSLHLIDATGVNEDSDWSLKLNLSGADRIGMKSLDDVIRTRQNGTGVWAYITWPYPWKKRDNGSHGSVAVYRGNLEDEEHDATLAEIWSTETDADMPRPAGQTSWNEGDVLKWVDGFRKKFSNLSEVMLEADTEDELYTLTDKFLLLNPVKRVYLHTRTWRGEYFPNFHGIDEVNTKVFPEGKVSLKKYADYLHSHNVLLKLHNVSCGIGLNDPDYIVSKVDRRLATWGSGKLAVAIRAKDKTITVAPSAETEWPPRLHPQHEDRSKFFRIGEEIIRFKELEEDPAGTWTLTGCSRGYGGTDPAAYRDGTEMVGLECPYAKNFVPADDLAQPDSLMNEMTLKMANLINYTSIDHIHFDGIEIHDISPWGRRSMSSNVYRNVDHQVTSSGVGTIIPANFEYEFSGLKDDAFLGYYPLHVDLRTERKEDDGYRNLATSSLHAHFHVQDMLAIGGRRVELNRAESGRGITRELLETHGLTGEVLQLWRYWLQLSPIFHEDDLAYVKKHVTKTPGSNHYQGEEVLVLGVNHENRYTFTPVLVLGQEGDTPWKIDQEWGAIPRYQTVQPGETLALKNPGSARDLYVVIRNTYKTGVPWTDPEIEAGGSGFLKVKGLLEPGESLRYTNGDTAEVFDKNWNLLRELPASVSSLRVPSGAVTITVGGEGRPDLQTQFIVTGSEYVLNSNDSLSSPPPGPAALGF